MKTAGLALLIAAVSAVVSAQDIKPVPKDSVEVEARGCLKGRVFTATEGPADEGTRRGPDISGRHFRVSAKRDVMDDVKKYNGQFVELVGIVRKAALDDQGIGMKVGRGRVIIGAPGNDPTRMNLPSTAPTMAGIDVTAVRLLTDACPIR